MKKKRKKPTPQQIAKEEFSGVEASKGKAESVFAGSVPSQ